MPHFLGIAAGFSGLAVAGGFGLAGLIKAVPQLNLALKFFGIVFLLFLVWKIGTATRATATGSSRPLSFLQAATFQWINSKVVTLLASTIVAYSTGPDNIVIDPMMMLPIFVLETLSSALHLVSVRNHDRTVSQTGQRATPVQYRHGHAFFVSMVPIFMG